MVGGLHRGEFARGDYGHGLGYGYGRTSGLGGYAANLGLSYVYDPSYDWAYDTYVYGDYPRYYYPGYYGRNVFYR